MDYADIHHIFISQETVELVLDSCLRDSEIELVELQIGSSSVLNPGVYLQFIRGTAEAAAVDFVIDKYHFVIVNEGLRRGRLLRGDTLSKLLIELKLIRQNFPQAPARARES